MMLPWDMLRLRLPVLGRRKFNPIVMPSMNSNQRSPGSTEKSTTSKKKTAIKRKPLKTQTSQKADPTTLFEKGKELYKAGEFEDAVKNFSDYLKNKNGKHVEEATFLRAESYYGLGKYQNAIIDYEKFTKDYKSSSYQP